MNDFYITCLSKSLFNNTEIVLTTLSRYTDNINPREAIHNIVLSLIKDYKKSNAAFSGLNSLPYMEENNLVKCLLPW